MNSKEEAIELVNEYMSLSFGKPIFALTKSEAKKCALKAVDRNVNILKKIISKEHSNNFWYIENAILKEIEVKQEIEKL